MELDLEYLYQEICNIKMETLFEEPCPFYEPEWEDVTDSKKDWEDFWKEENVSDGNSTEKN